MDDKSAARLKHREFRHDEKVPFKKSSQFQVDLDIDQEDVVLSGHFEQVYVETKDGKKKNLLSVGGDNDDGKRRCNVEFRVFL